MLVAVAIVVYLLVMGAVLALLEDIVEDDFGRFWVALVWPLSTPVVLGALAVERLGDWRDHRAAERVAREAATKLAAARVVERGGR